MSRFDAQSAIVALNQRLKDAGIAVSVQLNGKKLIMRATLPKKAKDGGIGKKQYPISLGISASVSGIKSIERKAHELQQQVDNNLFDWKNWEKTKVPSTDVTPARYWVEQFKEHYLANHRGKEATWVDQWARTYRRIPQNEPLSEAIIVSVVCSTPLNSETRNRTCQRMQALADYAGIAVDLSPHRGTYGHKNVKPRDLPDDELIAEFRDRVPNPAWQWHYGMMATFGLRPHEVFAIEFIDLYTVRVLDKVKTRTGFDKTKTGFHIARALSSEWAEQWNLIEVNCPKVTAVHTKDYGDRNKCQFQRYGIPFPAYNLRHAYALRGALKYGLDTSQMAKMMGHSEAIHIRTYKRWLDDAQIQRDWEAKVLKKPKPNA